MMNLKSLQNKLKHGIDFNEAKKLWKDNNSIIVPANIVNNEIRYALIAMLKGVCYVTIFTMRGNNFRIISVRKCRKNERNGYDKNNS
jgi:uncharacterized DUF497 family protein